MIERANAGHAVSYGDDSITKEAHEVFRMHFGPKARAYLVTTGTAANVVGLMGVTRSFEAVICADTAHLHRSECGAPERFLGGKLLTVSTEQGKLSPGGIEPLLRDAGTVHRAQPRVVSITQCTEVGTVYSVEETRALSEFCHDQGLLLHVDGARLCNAAAALGRSLASLTTDAGVDLLSFGGTKNGLLAAEAVLVLNPDCGAEYLEFIRKQSMQLVSKMRFLSAQFIALLRGDLWLRNARHANAMAERLGTSAGRIRGVQLAFPQQTNAVFARIPRAWLPDLQSASPFNVWDSESTLVRWMTSFDTTEDDIDAFVQRLQTCSDKDASSVP